MGSIPVNPKELLEDGSFLLRFVVNVCAAIEIHFCTLTNNASTGIRKELVRQISIAMHGILIFRTGKTTDFEVNLDR